MWITRLFFSLFFMSLPITTLASSQECITYKHSHSKYPLHCQPPKNYISFNYHPTALPRPVIFTPDDFYNPDLSTGDDDASVYPDMNIDR